MATPHVTCAIEGKKKKGTGCVCSICTEVIVGQTKTRKGQDAIFVKGNVKTGCIGTVQVYLLFFLLNW